MLSHKYQFCIKYYECTCQKRSYLPTLSLYIHLVNVIVRKEIQPVQGYSGYMVAYFCHHLPDNNVHLSNLYVDWSHNIMIICHLIICQKIILKTKTYNRILALPQIVILLIKEFVKCSCIKVLQFNYDNILQLIIQYWTT